MPRVSVIIPVYGVEKYIERCVRSLFSQTLSDMEFIFIDDCTPDLSVEILQKLIDEYNPYLKGKRSIVNIYKMPSNMGQAEVRRVGCNLATGDYVIHCDSDDWVDEDMYEKLYRAAVTQNSDVVICDFYQSTSCDDRYIKACYSTDRDVIICDLMKGRGYWSLCNKLIKRSLYDSVERFPVANMGEDMVLTLQLLSNSNKISYIETSCYHYFINETSIVRNKSVDSIVGRFSQVVKNVHVLEDVFRKLNTSLDFNFSLDYLKLRQLHILSSLLGEFKYYEMWKGTFPEIRFRILINPYVNLKEKVKYYLRLLRLYTR